MKKYVFKKERLTREDEELECNLWAQKTKDKNIGGYNLP